ncbi:uncharacterized protein LOC116424349 isoform X2 [Nomia melanderi]|uniref:uncharacterized protein LOC116424349 isoform X2 n=1 Tax=Nomia melanderi TaxID=2448451 RepID=UPI0013046531|nr:uncharacterized protein LOC116424349 isoform X2 [Nomia melanderi]
MLGVRSKYLILKYPHKPFCKMIQTFIFFDLETTGLIQGNCMPKITELSLIATSRSAICDTLNPIPRVLYKLILPIYPDRKICKTVETLTALSNENLENVKSFSCETYNLVNNFINQLKPPVCFIAYNGNKYDYPIFLWELENIGKYFSESILSVDMLHLVKDFFSMKKDSINQQNVAQGDKLTTCNTDINIMLNDGYDQILSDVLDDIMSRSFEKKNQTSIFKNEENKSYPNNVLSTPQTSCYKKIQEINEKTPENQIIKHSNTNLKQRKAYAPRRLNFADTQPSNFKLTSIYKHIVGMDPVNAHNAEGDCISMIHCAVKLGNFFVDWADCNAVPMVNHKKQ